MSSMMGSQSSGTTPAGGAGANLQSASVRSGATGASGIRGGSSTPVTSLLSPEQNAMLAKMGGQDFLKLILGARTGHGASQGGSTGGMAAFQNAPYAQGNHSISIASLFGGSGGGS